MGTEAQEQNGPPATRRRLTTRALSDNQLLLAAALAVLCAAALVVLIMFMATTSNSPTKTVPFTAGSAKEVRLSLEEGGPYFIADPFGNQRGFWFALEDDAIVALRQHVSDDEGCLVRWNGRVDSFVDCDDAKIDTRQLDRYATRVVTSGKRKGALEVDLRNVKQAPA